MKKLVFLLGLFCIAITMQAFVATSNSSSSKDVAVKCGTVKVIGNIVVCNGACVDCVIVTPAR